MFLAHSLDKKKANIIQKSRKNRAKEKWVEESGKLVNPINFPVVPGKGWYTCSKSIITYPIQLQMTWNHFHWKANSISSVSTNFELQKRSLRLSSVFIFHSLKFHDSGATSLCRCERSLRIRCLRVINTRATLSCRSSEVAPDWWSERLGGVAPDWSLPCLARPMTTLNTPFWAPNASKCLQELHVVLQYLIRTHVCKMQPKHG